MTQPDLAGIFPPLTTPFDDNGELDLAAFERNIELYNATGLAGYLIFGSNGEAVHLDPEERRRALQALRRRATDGKTVIVGINELSARAAKKTLAEYADSGADAALVITPYFYKGAMSQEVFRRFFLEVADASPLPIMVYNVPQNTGVVIAPATIAELARHERIVGVKDSAGNQEALAETIRRSPPDFQVLVGAAGILYPALTMGAVGAILGVACAAPAAAVAIYEAVRAGDHDRARELQHGLTPLAVMVTKGLGIPGLKAALDAAGYAGGAPRSPLRPIGPEDRERLLAVMRESGFFGDLPA